MTITYPINPPTAPGFRRIRFGLQRAVGMTQSPFSMRVQVYEHPGAIWAGDVELPPMTEDTAAPWAAFIDALRGRSGTFVMAPPGRVSPRGTQTANFVINGAHAARATSVAVTMTASATLLAGDRISIAQRLYRIVEDATADGGGAATLVIEPGLRTAFSGGETVKCDPPEVLLRLSANDIQIEVDEARLYYLAFPVEEAL